MAGATAVIGVGSPVMADDALGLHVLARQEAEWTLDGVTLIDGGTWGMKLLPDVEEAERLVFLDAINTQRHPPGTVFLLERDEDARLTDHNKLSPHQVGPREVLAISDSRGMLPSATCAIRVVPARVDFGTELSPVVRASVDARLERVIEQLRGRGHSCVRHEAPVRA